jgi:uncharacterized protein (TIGR02646 family)
MIQITKKASDCPKVLKNTAPLQSQSDRNAFDLAPDPYLAGRDHFENKSYYNRPSVKNALLKSHNNHKCCYCEQRRRRSELQVEHFRPRTASQQSKESKLIYPGYFWLAYSWDNLYLSCSECNGRFKKNLFPLENPRSRARSHNDPIATERRLLIDPGFDNPRDHLRFRLDRAYPFKRSKKARKTIEVIQLNDENLRSSRQDHIAVLQTLVHMVELSEAHPDPAWQVKGAEARAKLNAYCETTEVFSSMAKDFLKYVGYTKS